MHGVKFHPRYRQLVAGLAATLLTGLAWMGCEGSSGGNSPSTGGSSSAGGQIVATGGSKTGGSGATGGVTNSGGSPRTGGATGGAATGGAITGGTPATGGAPATGGVPAKDAGADEDGASTGGAAASGGSVTGGAVGSGGSPRSGGNATGGAVGSGGSVTGGTTGGQPGSGGAVGSGGSPGTGGTTSPDAGAPAYAPCPASGQCKIMPLGDSITEGTGFAGGYRGFLFSKAVADGKNITFVGSLTSNPPTNIANFPKAHEGHFAWTIQQIDDIVPTPTLNPSPHIILLHIGTNDINQNLSGAPNRLKSLITQIVDTLPNALVIVAKIIPEPSKASQITAYNNEIPAIVQSFASAGKHVLLIDQYTGFPSSELGDGVHPNQAGYSRMANTWYATLKPFLP